MPQRINTNIGKVAVSYIKLLKVKVTASSIKKSIEENPYYPSLLSLSDAFTQYNIDNRGFEIAAEEIEALEPPFAAYINVPDVGKDFVLVTSMKDNYVSYLYKKRKPETIAKDIFLGRYQKIVWTAKPDANSGELNFAQKLSKEARLRNKRSLWLLCAGIILILSVAVNVSGRNFFTLCTIALIKFTGLATTVLLLTYEIDKGNSLAKDICGFRNQINCDAALNSKASKIAGISWSEIGFFYFGSSTLWLLMPGTLFSNKIACIAIVNACAAPYIFFSIYYQWRKIKQWCTLCITVQFVLCVELIWSSAIYWVHPFMPLFRLDTVMSIFIVILLPIILLYSLKPVFIKVNDYGSLRAAYKRLQYNPEIFNSLLLQQAKVPDGWEHLGITIGNPAAENTVIKVCNPYCGPCAIAHPVLEELIKLNNNVKLKIIFMARNNENDGSAQPVKHLLAIAAKQNITETEKALADWYIADKKDYNVFAEKYPMKSELKQQGVKIDAMGKWCNEAEITHTPTFFVNGHKLPETYNVYDLKYFFRHT